MANNFQPHKQNAPDLRSLSVLFYGVPKVGKSTEAAKFPGAVLLNCEPGGTDLLKGEHEVFDVNGLDHLGSIAADLAKSQYKTIVLDGFTWMINQGVREEIKKLGGDRQRLRAYANITEQAQRVLGEILSGGKIVVATGHSRTIDVEGETDGKVEVRPDISPRLSDGVFGLFSIILYCYPSKDGSKMLTKPEDNDKRRILAGDRSGILPKVMKLSAEDLMTALRQTQPKAPEPSPTTEAPPSATVQGREMVETVAGYLSKEDWDKHAEALVEESDQSSGLPAKSKDFKRFMAVGSKAFGLDWNNARPWLVERYTGKRTPDNVRKSSNDLNDAELKEIADNIEKHNGALVEQWVEHMAESEQLQIPA